MHCRVASHCMHQEKLSYAHTSSVRRQDLERSVSSNPDVFSRRFLRACSLSKFLRPYLFDRITRVCPSQIGEKDFGHLTSDFETANPSPSTSTLKSEVRSLKSKMCPRDRMQVPFSAFILSFIFICCQARGPWSLPIFWHGSIGGRKKRGNRPPFFGRIPTCNTNKTRRLPRRE